MKNAIHPQALFRLSVLGQLASRDKFERGELKKIIQALSEKTYQIPGSNRVYLNTKTIERWYYLWCKHGIDGLNPKTRNDQGTSKLNLELQNKIITYKNDNPARSIRTIIKHLEVSGDVQKGALSRTTVHRVLVGKQISKRIVSDAGKIERRSFEANFANDLWHGDVMHGPRIQTADGLRKVYLVSLMDDASRLTCHSAFCLDETALSIEYILKDALLKRGIPKKIMIDNGPAYRSDSLQEICARFKIRVVYSRPYEPESKGKIERWHRSVRSQFLTEIDLNAIKSLDELNALLWVWIEQCYHQEEHSSLNFHLTPVTRYQQDLMKVIPLGQYANKLDYYFHHRIKRTIKKDATLSFDNKRYEVPFELVGEQVYLVYDPHKRIAKCIESLSYEPLGEVFPLDKIANNHRIRQRPQNLSTEGSKEYLINKMLQKTIKKFNITDDTE